MVAYFGTGWIESMDRALGWGFMFLERSSVTENVGFILCSKKVFTSQQRGFNQAERPLNIFPYSFLVLDSARSNWQNGEAVAYYLFTQKR